MMKKLRKKGLFLLAVLGLVSVQTNAQGFDFSADAAGWDNTQTISDFTYEATGGILGDGSIKYKRTGNNANIRVIATEIDADTNKYLKVNVANGTTGTEFRVLVTGAGRQSFEIMTNTGTAFKTYYVDLTSHPSWSGAAINVNLYIRKGYSAAEGFIEYDDITFMAAMPAADTTDPVLTSVTTATAIDENTGAGQVIYTTTATDAGGVKYFGLSGTDAGSFTINATTGAVTLTADPNFESKASYSFDVTAYDEATSNADTVGSATQTVTLAINDIAEGGDTTAPVITSLTTASVAENSGSAQAVYTITATDEIGVTTYGLAGTDAADFSISGNVITLTADPNFESKASYSFDVTAGDAAANTSAATTVTLSVTNVPEDTSYTFDTTAEGWTGGGNPPNAFSTTVTASGSGLAIASPEEDNSTPNPGNTLTRYVSMYGPNNGGTGYNTLDASHIRVTIKNETIGTLLRVRCRPATGVGAGAWKQQDFTITASDTGFTTYEFALGTTNWLGTDSDIAVMVQDARGAWTSTYQVSYDSIEFYTPETEVPVITSSATATAIAENSGASQAVYTITATDNVGVTSYALAGTDAADFTISGAVITLTGDPDFETKASYSFDVTASDAVGNTSAATTVTLAITDVVEPYTFDTTAQGWTSNGNPPNAFATTLTANGTGLVIVNPEENNTVTNPSGETSTRYTIMYGPGNGGAGFDADTYNYIIVTLKNETLGDRLRFRSRPATGAEAGTWKQQDFVITASDATFKTYHFALDAALWRGSDSDIAIAVHDSSFATSTPWTAALQVSYDSVEFTTVAPATIAGAWEDNATWGGTKPADGAPKGINSAITINSNVTSTGNITLTGGSLTVKNGSSLNLTGDLTTNNSLILEAGSQVIINGASTGTVEYQRTLTAQAGNLLGWYSVSPPVSGESLNVAWANTNSLVTSDDTNKRAIAWYAEGTDAFTYLLTSDVNATTFTAGQGYIIKRSASGSVSFTGTINTDNVLVPVTITGNGFNLLGNPYTSLVSSATFITENTADLSQQQVWIWDSANTTYDVAVPGVPVMLGPGQAFFVQANKATNLTFSESNQSTGTDVFQKESSDTDTKLKLTISNGTVSRYAKVYYLEAATTAYDAGYEGETFAGLPESFSLYTHLLEGNQGKNYQIQSLPNSGLEEMVVPVGLKVGEDSEITFKLEASNIPAGLKVFLEDRQEGIFTQLDVVDAEYKVSINKASDNIGRFYLHTAAKTVLSTDDIALQGVSIFNTNNTTLKIAGLQQGKASVSLFNIQGKEILTSSFQANGVKEIALPKLATGVYLVQLTTEAGKLNKKIILE